MSEFSELVATVQGATSSIDQTRQSVLAYQQKLAQYVALVIDRTQGTAQTDIKDCLIAFREAIQSLQVLQEALGQSVLVASGWLERNGGAGSAAPSSSHTMTFGSGYEPEEENTYSHRR